MTELLVLVLLLGLVSSNCSAVRVPAMGKEIDASSILGAITAAQNRNVARRRVAVAKRGDLWAMALMPGAKG